MHIRIKRLLKASARGITGVMVVLMAISCEWGDRTITLVRPDTEDLQVLYSDSVTVERSTVMKDSIYTGSGPMMTGLTREGVFGAVTAKAYFIPAISAAITLPARATYDSLVMVSHISYYYGDTLGFYRMSAHEILDEVSTILPYNNRGVNYDEASLGEITFRPRPGVRDSLRLRLSDQLGQKLFAEAGSNRLRNQDELAKNFKGVALEGEAMGSGSFIGLDASRTRVILYYHVDGPDGIIRYTADMTALQYYSQIVNDRRGTPFESLVTSRNKVSAQSVGGVSVIQAGAGLMTRLDFPFLHEFDNNQGKVIVNRAFLRIDLPRNSENSSMRPPERLGLYTTGVTNDWQLSAQDHSFASAQFVNDSVHNQRYYEMDVTTLVTSIVQGSARPEYGVLIGPLSGGRSTPVSTYASSLDRLILQQGAVKLKVYYTTLLD